MEEDDLEEEKSELLEISEKVKLCISLIKKPQQESPNLDLLTDLLNLSKKGVIQDLSCVFIFVKSFLQNTLELLQVGWNLTDTKILSLIYDYFVIVWNYSDVDYKPYLTKELGSLVLERLRNVKLKVEFSILKKLFHQIYSSSSLEDRNWLTLKIAAVFRKYLNKNEPPTGISEILEIVGAISRGYKVPLKSDHKSFLYGSILILHEDNQIFEDEQPVISSYHEQLVYAMTGFIEKDPNLVFIITNKLLQSWPKINSKKEVLFLHEIEKIIEYLPINLFPKLATPILGRLSICIRSPNFLVAERALQYWQNDYFNSLTKQYSGQFIGSIFPILIEANHWNPSVNKLCATVLGIFLQHNEVKYWEAAKKYWMNLSPPKVNFKQETEKQLRKLNPDMDAVEEIATHVPQKLPNIGYNNFVFGHVLGTGSYSEVRYTKLITHGVVPSKWPEFALKTINKELVKSQKYNDNIKREIEILSQISHPNIINLVAYFSNEKNIYLVLEYASKGDLHHWITELGSISEETTKFITAEIITALDCLGSQGIVYGDLKPENILIHKTGHIKLTDFGSARFESEIKQGDRLEGTAEYIAPELIHGQKATKGADLWALGCVIYQMLAGRTPVWAEEQTEIFDQIVKFSIERKYPKEFSEIAKDLIDKLMHKDPNLRIGAKGFHEFKVHDFFKDVQWDNLHTQAAPVLKSGKVEPQKHKKWARRKISMMFAPLPESYNFAGTKYTLEPIPELPL